MRSYGHSDRTIGWVLADKARTVGHRPFLHFRGETFRYSDADALVSRYANGFAARGVGRGDHVALMLPNCPELLWAVWGLGRLGAVAVPLNTAAKGELLRYLLTQSDSTLLCADPQWADRYAAATADLPGLRGVLELDELRGFGEAPATPPPGADDVGPGDPHLILYTSGTTGPSKGAVCPHSQGLAVGEQLATISGYGPDDVLYTCLPLFHGNALWYTVYAALWAEASVALYSKFSASAFWSEIQESGATVFNCLGAMANIIWQLPAGPGDRDHAVRICMMVPTSKTLVDGYLERYGITVTSVFAMTENTAVTVFGPDDPREKVPAAGRVREQVSVRIVDEDDQPVPAGTVGEICIRPNVPGSIMLGYYKMAEATVAATRDLWFHTGDRGHVDADGYLYFSDRQKEAIRRRGENISAYEVETVLCGHPGVYEAAAVAVPAELGEDEVMVYVVRAAGSDVSPAELVGYCADNMAYFMVPRYVEFLDELPKTPSEKVEKYKLKTAAAERIDELWDREKAGVRVRR